MLISSRRWSRAALSEVFRGESSQLEFSKPGITIIEIVLNGVLLLKVLEVVNVAQITERTQPERSIDDLLGDAEAVTGVLNGLGDRRLQAGDRLILRLAFIGLELREPNVFTPQFLQPCLGLANGRLEVLLRDLTNVHPGPDHVSQANVKLLEAASAGCSDLREPVVLDQQDAFTDDLLGHSIKDGEDNRAGESANSAERAIQP